jgi:sorting nexin-1/2
LSVEFDNVSRLVKSEFERFERERIQDFKHVLERYLDCQISQQKELVGAWEEYHGVVLKMVQKNQGQGR